MTNWLFLQLTHASQDLAADVHSHRAFCSRALSVSKHNFLGRHGIPPVAQNAFLTLTLPKTPFVFKNLVETLGPHVRVRKFYTSKAHRFAVVLRIDKPSKCRVHARVRAGPGAQRRFWLHKNTLLWQPDFFYNRQTLNRKTTSQQMVVDCNIGIFVYKFYDML